MSVWTNWISGQLILQFFDQGLNSEVWEGKKQVPSLQIEGTFLVSHSPVVDTNSCYECWPWAWLLGPVPSIVGRSLSVEPCSLDSKIVKKKGL